ncbi:MAG: DoxX family membrane protein [Steroidobacteraceae bacterium]
MIPVGIRIYGLGAIATGLVGLAWGDFALQWEPVAASFPGRTALAYLFAGLLVVAGSALNWRRSSAGLGAAALVALYAVVVVLMHGAQIIQHPGAFVTWSGAAEQLALLAGGLAAYACLAAAQGASAYLSRVTLITMGVCLLIFGLAHFLYLDFTASMVPAWLPGGQRFWASLTGVAHLLAGLALLSGIQARLAAILLTVMFASFSPLVHLPTLAVGPQSHLSWVINAINLALTGAAWSIATMLAQTNTRRAKLAASVPA